MNQYKGYIVGAAVLVVLQSALIAWLLVSLARRRRSELALRESEERFRLLANGAPVMVWTARPDTTLDFVSATICEFTGLSLEQLLDNGWLEHIHPEDVEPCQRIYVPAVEARRPFQMEYRLRRADGAFRWVLDTGVPRYGPDGSFAGYIGSSIDITDLKQTEAALRRAYEQNHDLAGRLINAQEAERTRIARDLHDDVSQQLAGVGILLSGLKRLLSRSGPQGDVDETMSALQQRTARLAHAIRHLSHELHPGVLKHAGLVEALMQHCAEVGRHHGITVTVNAPDDLDSLDFDVALCLYRVAQEALTNVVRHAHASVALVELTRIETGVELSVIDDGIGFVASDYTGSGLGLRSIDERVRLTRGSVKVESRPGEGTNLRVRIPVAAEPVELVRES
jgi:PAS domain S-box-containing protein